MCVDLQIGSPEDESQYTGRLASLQGRKVTERAWNRMHQRGSFSVRTAKHSTDSNGEEAIEVRNYI